MPGWWPSEYKLYTEEEINKAKPKIDTDKLNKDVAASIIDANNLSKLWSCTPQSIEADLKSLMSSLNSVDAWATTQRPNDTTWIVMSGTTTETLQKAIQPWDKIPDQLKSAFNNIWSMVSNLSPELWRFIESILWFLGIKGFKLWNKESNTETDKAKLEKLKNEEKRKILDSYGVTIGSIDNKLSKLTFLPDTKIVWIKTLKPVDPTDGNIPIKKDKIQLEKDGSIILDNPNIKSVDIKENDSKDGFTLTVVNSKDGSIDTYTIASAKKTIEAQKAQP